MKEKEKEINVDERKEVEVKEIKPQELSKLGQALEEAKENKKKLFEMASKYMEEPTLYDGFDRKIKEADRTIVERNIEENALQKDEGKKVKKPSFMKRFFTKVIGFFKKLFKKKKPEVKEESTIVRAQDMPRVKEEIEKAKETRRKLEEMAKPYVNYPKFDGLERHTHEIEELDENIPEEEKPTVEVPQKPIPEEEYDIQMEEVDDGENA